MFSPTAGGWGSAPASQASAASPAGALHMPPFPSPSPASPAQAGAFAAALPPLTQQGLLHDAAGEPAADADHKAAGAAATTTPVHPPHRVGITDTSDDIGGAAASLPTAALASSGGHILEGGSNTNSTGTAAAAAASAAAAAAAIASPQQQQEEQRSPQLRRAYCQTLGCNRQAGFSGPDGGTEAIACSRHKEPGALNLSNRVCQAEGCQVRICAAVSNASHWAAVLSHAGSTAEAVLPLCIIHAGTAVHLS